MNQIFNFWTHEKSFASNDIPLSTYYILLQKNAFTFYPSKLSEVHFHISCYFVYRSTYLSVRPHEIVVGLSLSSDCISIVQTQKQFMRCFLIIVFLGFLWLHWKRRRSGDFSLVIFSFSLLLRRPRDFHCMFSLPNFLLPFPIPIMTQIFLDTNKMAS